ncbi:MAG: hypothetical protein CMJ81_15780 [Planctomycetaceae bacterium]|nr:hypothetical protein [Planctomycetaceae bacterium]MBP63224.1 hypothetical protein [Planctomycetaceae bacterium]
MIPVPSNRHTSTFGLTLYSEQPMILSTPLVLGTLVTWITPIWLLGIGAGLGLVVLLTSWALIAVFSRRLAVSTARSVREGILWPILVVVFLVSLISLIATSSLRNPTEILSSLTKLPQVGTTQLLFTLPGPDAEPDSDGYIPAEETPQEVNFRLKELQRIVIEAPGNITVRTRSEDEKGKTKILRVAAGEPLTWFPPVQAGSFFPGEEVTHLYLRNLGTTEVNGTVTIVTEVPYPEVRGIVVTAVLIAALFLIYLVIQLVAPKAAAIALSTAKSEIAQPMFLVAVSLGIFLLLIFVFIPYNTFGEDVKVLKDTGLTTIMILSLLVAVYASGTSVAEEIDGRTALTVLSKPVSRRQFVLGKFMGILWLVLLVFVILGILFLFMISYKVVYDARETTNPEPLWQDCYLEMVSTVPGLALVFMETVVLASLSVAISTRLPLLPNFVIMFSIYVLGHLTPLIVHSALLKEFEPVVFVGWLIACAIPVLDHFNIQAAVAAGVDVPLDYLGWSFVYCVLYSAMALLLALTLFEDRDLA